MKNIVLILTFLLAVTTNAQVNYLMWENVDTQRFGKETLFKTDNKLLNGSYKIAENSGAYTEVTFANGKMVGTKKNYD
ncbi:MAG: toxin-antitoxin system YwqK family antitoxin, partial [Cellulophaga sp.]